VYVHCAAHNLNLVVNDAVAAVHEVQSFFYNLAGTIRILWTQYIQTGIIVVDNWRVSIEASESNAMGWPTVINYGR